MIELSDAQRELLYSKDEFTVEEAAEILGCSIYTVRRKIKEGAMSADGGTGRGGYRIPYMSINLYIAMVNGDMSAIYDTDSNSQPSSRSSRVPSTCSNGSRRKWITPTTPWPSKRR